jgi:hypothetical protein
MEDVSHRSTNIHIHTRVRVKHCAAVDDKMHFAEIDEFERAFRMGV